LISLIDLQVFVKFYYFLRSAISRYQVTSVLPGGGKAKEGAPTFGLGKAAEKPVAGRAFSSQGRLNNHHVPDPFAFSNPR